MPLSRCRRLPVLASLAFLLTLAACQVAPPGAGSGALPGAGTPGAEGGAPAGGLRATDSLGLNGLAARDVVAKLGDPNFRRHEAPAEVWQYFGPSCVLDLFLYEDQGAQRVAYVELRSRSAAQGADAACLSQLLAGRRGESNS